MYKGVGVRFADFTIFLQYPKLFHFHRIFENGEGRGFKRTHSGSATVLAEWNTPLRLGPYILQRDTIR